MRLFILFFLLWIGLICTVAWMWMMKIRFDATRCRMICLRNRIRSDRRALAASRRFSPADIRQHHLN